MLALLAAIQIADPLAVVDDAVRSEHDILHYHIGVSIPDEGSAIAGVTTIEYVALDATQPLRLDFDEAFTIDSITPMANGTTPRVSDGMLLLPRRGRSGDTLTVTVYYHGTPNDGLFIQNNVHGRRTAFADNWPNRARHWFPGEDHPSDKATASFQIEVPSGWRAIANGLLQRVDTVAAGRTQWHWRVERNIPTYTMVIGAGPLTVTERGVPGGISHTVWAFPEDSAFAVDVPFRRVQQMVEVYTQLVGPFPYAKLAHVQSSSRFGGMENSSAIFYSEKQYADRTMGEGVVAHETAHQWFGDAVTELDWHHLWLSEGFASYFDPLFWELTGDTTTFRDKMREKKAAYLSSSVVDRPVIDTAQTDLFALLNANNYSKGAWILHMLRGEVGDSAFFQGVREYYRTYRDSTALTVDLMRVMERHGGRSLRAFFEQWLTQPGYPQISVNGLHRQRNGSSAITLTQVQPSAWQSFKIDVPLVIVDRDGNRSRVDAVFESGSRTARVGMAIGEPSQVVVDPDSDFLLTVVKNDWGRTSNP